MLNPARDSSRIDIPLSAQCIRWYAEAIDKLYDEIAPTGPEAVSLIRREPLGVIAAVVPGDPATTWAGPHASERSGSPAWHRVSVYPTPADDRAGPSAIAGFAARRAGRDALRSDWRQG